jgi:hypothetical protein
MEQHRESSASAAAVTRPANDDRASSSSLPHGYASALAEALRVAEQTSSSLPSSEDVVLKTYTELCMDQPHGLTQRGCTLLVQALLASAPRSHSSVQLRISPRLVQGVLHVTNRVENNGVKERSTVAKASSPSPSPTHQESIVDALVEETSLLWSASTPSKQTLADASMYSLLAWTCLARIPLLAILEPNIDQAAAWLGSFPSHPVPIPMSDAPTKPDEGLGPIPPLPHVATQDGQGKCSIVESFSHEAVHTRDDLAVSSVDHGSEPDSANNNNNVDNSTHEVWAAQSDPSDYDFDSGYDYAKTLRALDDDAAWYTVDPHQLSTISTGTTGDDVALAVHSLLSHFHYHCISRLRKEQWQQHKIADGLTQLVLTLLLVPSTAHDNAGVFSINHNAIPPAAWQRLGLRPLHVFRDAVLDRLSNGDTSLVPSYLQLLQTLLHMDTALARDKELSTKATSTNTTTSGVEVATWVGLSALSAFSTHLLEQASRTSAYQATYATSASHTISTKLQPCILECCDDLAHCLETAAMISKGDDVTAATLMWTLLPIGHALAHSLLHGTSVNADLAVMTKTQAQTVLNSGLFSQWLKWWQRFSTSCRDHRSALAVTEESDHFDLSKTLSALESCLRELCVASPSLLGKYAWRFPGFPGAVTHFRDDNDYIPTVPIVDLLLWNLVGLQLAEHESVNRVQWKTKTSVSDAVIPAPSTETCQKNSWLLLQSLCRQVEEVLVLWKSQRLQTDRESAILNQATDTFDCQKSIVHEFVRLIEHLRNRPLLQRLFLQKMLPNNDGSSTIEAIQSELRPLHNLLRGWPSAPGTRFKYTKVKLDGEHDEKESRREPLPTYKPEAEDEVINSLRKALKIFSSTILSEQAPMSHGYCAASSKVD